MSYFDLDPTVEANALSKLGTIQPGDMGPGFFSGAGTGLARGAAQLTMTPAALLADAATPMLRDVARPFDQLMGSKIEDWLIGQQAQARRDVARFMPGPDVGTFGQLMFGGAQIIPQAIVGGVSGGPFGAAALPGALQGYQTMLDMQAKGVDQATAAGVGGIAGLMTAAGVAVPATMGGRLLPTIGLGVGANVTQGAVTRGSTGALLEARGYKDMAKQYQAFDTEAMIIDAVLGVALGGVALGLERVAGRPAASQIKPSLVDEALLAAQRQHADAPTAPGVPTDPASRTAHTKALEKAVADLVNDRPVDVTPTGVADAEFVPNRAQMQAAVEAATAELSPLGKLLNEVDTLRAEVEAAGVTPADDPLFTGRPVAEAPVAPVEAPAPRDFPSTVPGRAGEVFVGERSEPVRFMLVEAGDLSGAVAKGDNQFRDRTRAASQLQIAKIANDLQFGRLGEAPTMAEGAPTLANDGRVVGGNGRVLAIQRAYDQGTAAGYRAALADRAIEFGLTREQVEGLQQPVLVRQFQNQVDVRQAAILSNEGGALRMSALEQAKVDAERMPSLNSVELPESGDFTAASMRQFVRQWLSRYPQAEQGNLIAGDGNLSAEGALRMRNAVLYSAYGDSPTLARLVESTDERQRNIAGALVKAAPTVAEARALIETGALHDRDIQSQLLEAVAISQRLRADGMRLDDFLAQTDAFSDPVGPETTMLLRHLEANTRSQRAIADAVTGYYDAVRALGDPRQASMFDAEPPGRAEILRAVLDGRKLPPEAPSDDATYGGRILKSPDLPPDQQAVEARFAAWILEDVDRAVREYGAHPETQGGKVLNTDIARDLSRDYNATKDTRSTLSAAVHEPASWLVKEIYRRKLAEAPAAGERAVVTFTAGGTGAGKSSAIEKVPVVNMAVRASQVVYDTNMNTLDTARGRIEQALAAGKDVALVFVARDPVFALTAGALPRAMRQGRTVPLSEHAKTHQGAAKVLKQLAKEYEGDSRVAITVVDNTGPNGTQAVAKIARVEEIDYTGLEARLRKALEDEYANGRISEVVYRGTVGGDAAAPGVRAPAGDAAGTGQRPDAENAAPGVQRDLGGSDGAPAAPADDGGLIDAQVGQILDGAPNAQLVGDDAMPRTAAVALAEADTMMARTEKDADAYPAAVACALRG